MLDPRIKYDPWTITDELGKGSFGTVYKIEREDFGLKVDAALKVIPIPQSKSEVTSIRSQGLTDEEVTKYFYGLAEEVVKEFHLMFQLKGHSNIVGYEDHEIRKHDDGVGYDIIIRMELLEPLDEYCSHHEVTQQGVAKLGIDICRALERCHSLEIVHRDIKPSNIFVSKQGDFKLGDFGIARKMESQTTELSRKGTLGFMAPEVASAIRYDFTVDIYSMGLVMYKLLNGHRLPFMPPAGQLISPSDQSEATVRRLSGEPLPPPANACDALAKVILKASAFTPEDRYQSASEFKAAIKAALPEILAADEATLANTSSNSKPAFAPITKGYADTSENSFDETLYPTTLVEENYAFEDGKFKTTVMASPEELTTVLEEDDAEVAPKPGLRNPEENFSSKTSDKTIEKGTGLSDQKQRSGQSQKSNKGVIAAVVVIVAIVIAVIAMFGIQASTQTGIFAPQIIDVPAVKGMTQQEAESALSEAGFIPIIDHSYNADVEKDVVISQNITGKADKGSEIAIMVSNGIEQVEVPNVEGMSKDEASGALKGAGFSVTFEKGKYDDKVAEGKIITQSIEAGSMVDKGTKIKLTPSLGKEPEPEPEPAKTSSNSGSGYTGKKPGSGSSSKPSKQNSDFVFG